MDLPLAQVVELLRRVMDWHKVDQSHGSRVAEMAVQIGRLLNGGERLDEARLKMLSQAAILHDLGRVGVDDLVLAKPGVLTDSQRAAAREHVRIGYEITHDLLPAGISLTILSHHERWDGSGYPNGLKGLDIPLYARIVSICDVWDALISDRPYRKAYPSEIALKMMNEMADQFDPLLFTIFLHVLKESQ